MENESKMIISNPGVNCDTEMNISWHTKPEVKNSKIIYTTCDDINWEHKVEVNASYHYCDVFNDVYSITKDRAETYEKVVFNHYHVELYNLQPDTKYMYKVGEKVFSDVHYFKTAKKEFSFAWVSDFHAYNPIPSRLRCAFDTTKKVIEHENGADFILCGGDAIAWGGSYSFWDEMYKEDLVKDYMWVNMLGNHDFMSRGNLKNNASYFIETNNFPKNGHTEMLGDSFYFTYGDTLFIVINSEDMGFVRESEKVTRCRNWLEDILSKTKCKYTIVCQHYDWFEGVSGKSREFGYNRYKDLFDKYHVTLALANNNHVYIRTFPLYNDKIDPNGTYYVQSPSSDNERGQTLKEMIYNNDIIAKRFSEGGNTIGIIFVRVTNNNINLKLYDRNLNIIDEFNTNK